jgi:hypothetical protein
MDFVWGTLAVLFFLGAVGVVFAACAAIMEFTNFIAKYVGSFLSDFVTMALILTLLMCGALLYDGGDPNWKHDLEQFGNIFLGYLILSLVFKFFRCCYNDDGVSAGPSSNGPSPNPSPDAGRGAGESDRHGHFGP